MTLLVLTLLAALAIVGGKAIALHHKIEAREQEIDWLRRELSRLHALLPPPPTIRPSVSLLRIK